MTKHKRLLNCPSGHFFQDYHVSDLSLSQEILQAIRQFRAARQKNETTKQQEIELHARGEKS